MNPLPIILMAGAAVAWLWSRKPEPAPAPKRKRAAIGSLKWDEGVARAAACASFKAGITDELELSKIIGNAMFPQQTWPPRLGHRAIWSKIKAVARDVIAGGCDD